MPPKKRPSEPKSWQFVKAKKKTIDVFGEPVDKETSEDCGKAFEYAIGTACGLNMLSLNHRLNSGIDEVAERIAAAALGELGSKPVLYTDMSDGHPCNFVLDDGRTLEVRFSRDREKGDGYPPMSGQPGWESFIETFSEFRPGVPFPPKRDDAYAKEMFVRCWPRMLRRWLADMFCSDVRLWAWASSVSGPGYVIIRRQDVGWGADSCDKDPSNRRRSLPSGLSDGDFIISKQEVAGWKTVENEIKFYWNAKKGWITVGMFKLQSNRGLQFGFKMLNLMMVLGLAARRAGRPCKMFECVPLSKRIERIREPVAQTANL